MHKPRRKARVRTTPKSSEVVVELSRVQQVQILHATHHEGPTNPQTPSAFEKESYELYLRTRRDVRSLSIKTAIFTFLVVALVLLGAQVHRTNLAIFEIGAINNTLIVGVLGWCATLYGAATLWQAAFAARKKHQSGLFYQRVLHFSSNPLTDVAGRISTVVYVAAVVGAILLTLILARQHMFYLVTFIVRNLVNLIMIGPWETRVLPTP